MTTETKTKSEPKLLIPGTIKASETKDAWGLNMIIYGAPGVGKTILCASAQDSPHGKDVLFLDVEGGTRSISDRNDIDVLPISNWSQLSHAYDKLTTGEHTYKTIVMDSLSKAYDLGLDHVLEESKRPRPTLQDFGDNVRQVCNMVQAYTELARTKGWNILFTSLLQEMQDEQGPILQRLALSPKTRREVEGIVDGLGYLTIDRKDQRILHLAAGRTFLAKIRQPIGGKNRLPSKIENPTMAEILECLNS